MKIPIVIHPEVENFLSSKVNLEDFSEIKKCIEKLSDQIFDGGLRVKKLQGGSHVWEARVNRADRIIFTYEKSIDFRTGNRITYIAIQDFCQHDDVNRRAKARARSLQKDITWLDSEGLKSFGDLCNDILNFPEPILHDIYEIEQNEINNIYAEDIDNLFGKTSWKIIDSIENFEHLIRSDHKDLPLKLTHEEYHLATLHKHLIVQGGAGTGKTTIGIHRLLESLRMLPSGKRLYVTRNPALVRNTQELFYRLLREDSSPIAEQFEFLSFRDFCLSYLEIDDRKYSLDNFVDYFLFENIYLKWSRFAGHNAYPPGLVWGEIYGLIKGSQVDPKIEKITSQEYKILNRKSSSFIPKNERSKVYKIAEKYQSWLDTENLFDEIDLARQALLLTDKGRTPQYQMIVCDEVQDLTEIQILLLVKSIKSGGLLFFSGDLNQIVTASGFRWESLNYTLFQKNNIFDASIAKLSHNFRNSSEITHLSSRVLLARDRILSNQKSSCSSILIESDIDNPIRIFNLLFQELKAVLEDVEPNTAILVRSVEVREKLRILLESSFVYTINEIKGLEFDFVILFNFFEFNKNIWADIIDDNNSVRGKKKSDAYLEFNLLYVAITRACKVLYIVETHVSKFWNFQEFKDIVYYSEIKELGIYNEVRGDEFWRGHSYYFYENGFYQQTIECISHIEELNKKDRKILFEAKRLFFLRNGEYSKLALLMEENEEWDLAAQYWHEASDFSRSKTCLEKRLSGSQDDNNIEFDLSSDQDKNENAIIEKENNNRNDIFLKNIGQENNGNFVEKNFVDENNDVINSEAQEFYEKACSALEYNDLRIALMYIELALKQNPSASKLLYSKGYILFHSNSTEKAIEFFTKAIKINPNHVDSLNYRGSAYMELGKLQKAIADLDAAIQIDPSYCYAYNNRGNAFQRTGRYEEALLDFDKALELDPLHYQALLGRACIQQKINQFDLAIKSCNEAIELQPRNAFSYALRGKTYFLQGNCEQALKDYKKALIINPNYYDAYTYRSELLFSIGNFSMALKDCVKAVDINPMSADAHFNLGECYLELGSLSESLKCYSEAIKINPRHVFALSQRSRIKIEKGDFRGAIRDCTTSLKIEPKFAEALFNRAAAYSNLQMYVKAKPDIEEALIISLATKNYALHREAETLLKTIINTYMKKD